MRAAFLLTVLDRGFLVEKQRSSTGKWQRFGSGFYMAPQASKSHTCKRPKSGRRRCIALTRGFSAADPLKDMRALPAGLHVRSMILCRVAKGRVWETDTNHPELTGRELGEMGFHSVHGVAEAHGVMKLDEFVVYHAAAILPLAVVTYEFTKLRGPGR